MSHLFGKTGTWIGIGFFVLLILWAMAHYKG